jgi:uncharacterized delta-60 repeat protein
MRKLRIVALSGIALALVFTGGLSAAAGDLDPTFGDDGTAITDFGGDDVVNGVATQADGKIVAAGYTRDPANGSDFAVARYNRNGSLDSGFGTGGRVRTDFGGSDDRGSAVAVQADGKVVVAGWALVPDVTVYTDVALARYNVDGSLDSSFGSGGKVLTNLERTDFANDLAIQPDGKIVVVGGERTAPSGHDYAFATARYNPNGSLDTTFGGSGYVITPFTEGLDSAEGVVVQPDGKIVAVGVADASSPDTQDLALVRYNTDGSLDAGFDSDGKVQTRDPASAGGWNVARQADGKLVVAGGIVARYNPDGSIDSTFGSAGKVALGESISARVVLVEPDRELVVAGTYFNPDEFVVAKLKQNGSPDKSFGDNGQVRTDVGIHYDDAYAAVLQADGRIVVGGATYADFRGPPADFALARYLNPAPCKVPNVRGRKLRVAKARIRTARCGVGIITRKRSKQAKKGRVLSQRPKAGTTVPSGTEVSVVVGKGRPR